MNIKDIAGSDIKPLLKYIEEQTSKDNAYLYRTEFKHIAEMASSHPYITIDEYKKLLADSAKSGRLQTLRLGCSKFRYKSDIKSARIQLVKLLTFNTLYCEIVL